jgi:putative tryptophan/tyrosine transport system substrate-binding protein
MQASGILIASFLSFTVAVAATGAEPEHVPQLGFLAPRLPDQRSEDVFKNALMEGLRQFGYVEGQTIHVEPREATTPEEFVEMAHDLVGRNVDVIGTLGPGIDAVRRATNTIPIVIIACDRADRLVANIARPGGNITGMACISSDLAAKRLQLLQEAVPGISRVSVLFNGGEPAKVEELQDIQAAANTMEIRVQPTDVRDASGFSPAFATMKAANAQAVLTLSDNLTFGHLKEIAAFAAEQRLPSMYGFKEFCDVGGLLCYGANLQQQFRRYGYFIDKILKGTKAGDIPIEEPLKHDLVVNARVAKSLGLSLPLLILVRADDVME